MAYLPELLAQNASSTSSIAITSCQTIHGAMVQVAGLVLRRQRPASVKGVLFLTLEDETGLIDVIVRPEQLSAHKWALMQASWLIISGMVQRDEARVAVLFHGVIRQ